MTEFINALRAAFGLGAIDGRAVGLVVTAASIASYGAGGGSAACFLPLWGSPGGLHVAHVQTFPRASDGSLWSAAIAAARCEGAEAFRRSMGRQS